MNVSAIIPAGGIGTRMGLNGPKQFVKLAGVPLLVHTLRAFEHVEQIREIIVAAPESYLDQTRKLIQKFQISKTSVVKGGKLRQDSVQAGLAHVAADCDFVLVHDGARPLITAELICACLEAAHDHGAAMAAIPVNDTIKDVDQKRIIRHTVNRETLWQAQTPQVVRTDILKRAFAQATQKTFVGTDEASFLELINEPMMVVEGSEQNIKVTRPDDLLIAEAILMNIKQTTASFPSPRIGHGYDAHCLVSDRPLILGGVEIAHPKGLLGHSDADVLTHALCDAILGALGEGDIGKHFPDNDPIYKGISSIKLLEQVIETANKQRFTLSNADITIIAQQPKLSPHFPAMKENLARACLVEPSAINLKGTTTEKMGFAGREEGIATHAVVLIQGR